MSDLQGCIDAPVDGELVHRHAFTCEGWFVAGSQAVVEATVDGVAVGASEFGFARADVEAALGPETGATGFAFSCEPPEALRDRPTAQLVVTVRDETGSRELGRRWLRFSRFDYRANGHGDVLTDDHPGLLHRSQVYGSGPPSPDAFPPAVRLIERQLRPGDRIVDIGCGIGAYGRVLAELGYDWTGAEVRPEFVAAVREAGLWAEAYDGLRLPFEDGAFDVAVCIEVLEHVEAYAAFVAEIARVTRRIAFVSVPNYETVPVMAQAYAVPWHLLESDHKNFFTRRGLARVLRASFPHVEVVEYGEIGSFRTPDEVPIYNHLMALARCPAPPTPRAG